MMGGEKEGGGVDWNRIRKDYIAGKGSYRDLARKYGVSPQVLAAGESRGLGDAAGTGR